jgi:hypothetical protein
MATDAEYEGHVLLHQVPSNQFAAFQDSCLRDHGIDAPSTPTVPRFLFN